MTRRASTPGQVVDHALASTRRAAVKQVVLIAKQGTYSRCADG